MSLGLIGYKLGMTQVFTESGVVEPVTVLQLGPCPILQIKYPAAKTENGSEIPKDGYSAVQLGFKDKPRKSATRPEQGHVAANLKSKRKEARLKAGVQLPPKADCEPQRHIREFRLDKGVGFIHKVECGPAEAKLTVERIRAKGDPLQPYEAYTEDMTLKVGQVLTVSDVFKDVLAVDVTGTSKGRGTQGVMKRHNFAGLPAAHGAKKVHRQAGSTASLGSNRGSGRPKKGLRRAGRYGNERVTIRNLTVVKLDPENNLLLVRGGIPGHPGSLILVRPTNKVGPGSPKSKTRKRVVVAKKK
jgi:large subunit ribosomal protein L3